MSMHQASKIIFPCAHEIVEKKHTILGCEFDDVDKVWSDREVFKSDYIVKFSAHYLDFLNSKKIDFHEKFLMILEYYKKSNSRYFYHSYSCSRRIINIHNFILNTRLSGYELMKLIGLLREEYHLLRGKIEYEIDANHLLTNLCALACCEHLFSSKMKYKFRYLKEFKVQFSGGLHYERSFSYHSLLVNEFLLYCVIANENNLVEEFFNKTSVTDLYGFLSDLDSYPQFGDCFSDTINDDMETIKPHKKNSVLSQNEWFEIGGYWFFVSGNLKIIVDGGRPSPSFQPGHAHSSTLSINIFFNGKEVVTNLGTNTYDNCKRRDSQRAQSSYSSPQLLNGENLQEVWSSFRVAKRRPIKFQIRKAALVLECGPVTREIRINGKSLSILDSGSESSQLIVRCDARQCIKVSGAEAIGSVNAYKSLSKSYPSIKCEVYSSLHKDQPSITEIELK